MENLKHTKAYAEKLAEEKIKQQPDLFKRRSILVEGYMLAIKETGVEEMLDFIIHCVDNDCFKYGNEESAKQLINKAKP